MRKLILFLFPLFIQAQDVSIGSWKDYQSYNAASYICEAENKIYCVTSGGLFYLNKIDNTINRMSKITGISDVGVKQIAYSEKLNIIIITYDNCNVDLLKNNKIINISDIKRAEIQGIKKINNITLKDEVAYLSCSFGLVLINLEKEEVQDTYSVEESNDNLSINGCAFLGDSIFVATTNGVYFAESSHPNLSDHNNWSLIAGQPIQETYDNIVFGNNSINGDYSHETTSISYNNKTLLRTKIDRVEVDKEDGTHVEVTDPKFQNILYAWMDNEHILWVADHVNGLLRFVNYEYQENFIPEGPKHNDIYSIEFLNSKLFLSHGGHFNYGVNYYNKTGVSIMKNNYYWINEDYYDLGWAWDILEVAVYNEKEYYASWYDGIPVLDGTIEDGSYRFLTQYGYHNTGGALDTSNYSNNRIRVSDLKFDSNGNLWGLNSEVEAPLFVKTNDNNWYSFSMGQDVTGLFFDDLLIDSWGQKWGVIGREGGLFVYNDNNTINDISDDQFNILTTNIGDGNLPSTGVRSIAEDLERTIWVGTDKGIAVFYNPSSVFSGYNFDSQQILIQEGEYGQYLLSEERIKCIAIDGANRKWVGTEKSGIFLLSADGSAEILHFTSKNSPLFSNNIIDIAINHDNGEVFIGTSKGLLSYRSDATKGVEYQSKTHVFPNPVRETYFGPIAIKGLVSNANIKITDVNGNLVFEDYAKGGQAIWNGKNKNNERAASGVYLVFSVDDSGVERMVSKILFIK